MIGLLLFAPWSDVEHQISGVERDFIDIVEDEKFKPEIHLSVVFLTDKEWDVEFKKWDRIATGTELIINL